MKIFQHNPIQIENISAVTDDTGKRVYLTPEGKPYPSVTTVLSEHTKQGIIEWRNKIGAEEANKISRQAASRGSRFHTLAEKYLQNSYTDSMVKTPLDRMMITNAQPILDRIDNIRAQEVGLWSHHLRMAGRVDCIAEFDGKLSVIDFKTARREKDEDHIQHYYMQAAAYAIMFEERTSIPISRLVIAIAVEDGTMQVFKGKRDMFVKNLLYYRDLYENKYM